MTSRPDYASWFFIACAVILLLSTLGCAQKQTLKGSGVEVLPHPSYLKLCAEHPEVEACHEVR